MNKERLEESIKFQAQYIEKLNFANLSDKVVEQAKLILLDSLGCIAVGNTQYDKLPTGNGIYSVVGKAGSDKQTAIFINGCAMVKNEMDEGNQFAFGHPACHFIPAFLAECQDIKDISGRDAITALVAAYEVSCRWGCSAKPKPRMHVHGTMQTAGSAVVVSKLNGLNKDEIEKSIILANSLPQPTTWASAFHGDQLRNAYVGLSNEIGSHATKITKMGIESSIESLSSVWGEILDGNIDEDGLVKDLGQDYYITKNYFKIHAACRYTHSFADTIQNLMESGLQAADIEKIEIDTYHAASKLSGQEARNSFAARFSIPITLAVKLIFGNLTTESLSEENIHNEKVQSLAKKIFVNENRQYNELLPAVRKNKMTVIKRDGSVIERESSVTKGDYLDPFSKEEVINKFYLLSSKVWSRKRQDRIVDFIDKLDTKESIRELFELIGNEM